MPIPVRSATSSEPDTYSLMSQATTNTNMTIAESLAAQLVRKTIRRGFTFNIMLVGPPGLDKTTLLSSLFGRNLDVSKEKSSKESPILEANSSNNLPIIIESKTFELDERYGRLKLTVVGCKNYGEPLYLKNTHIPIVDYIDLQFADYHKRESGFDRRNLQDKMIHCLFFFISPIGHGLSKLDIEFLKSIDGRINIVPIIAKAEAFTVTERAAIKRRVKDDLEKNNIKIYQMPDPEHDESDEIKRVVKEIQDAMPFAINSIARSEDNSLVDRCLSWAKISPNNKDHSDYLLLKTMLNMQMQDLRDVTHEIFYEQYRLRKMNEAKNQMKRP